MHGDGQRQPEDLIHLWNARGPYPLREGHTYCHREFSRIHSPLAIEVNERLFIDYLGFLAW